MAVKSGEERLKEMEAEMALFEQEVLGGPVPISGSPPVMDPGAVALAVPVISLVRPIIGTNTYRQVQQTLEARATSFVGPPPTFVGPVPSIRSPPPPIMRPAFVPHILQRPSGQRIPMMRSPPVAPPLPRPPPPPPMMVPPSLPGPIPHGPPQPIQHIAASPQVGDIVPMMPGPPRSVGPPSLKPTPSIIQAAPTVYSAPPVTVGHKRVDPQAQRQARMEELAARVAKQQAAVLAAGLLDKKESDESNSVIGPNRPEPEPPHIEPVESSTEDKKKGKNEKVKKCIRTAAGSSWEDASLLEWESDDFRIFCGDLGNEVNDDILARTFSRYPSFLKAKVVRDKRTGKTKGYGFVSFKDPNDYVRAMREMNGKYVGSRPIKLRKSMWKDRNIEVVRKKQKEKKKLGLR
ncbi:RNA-binding protein 42 [Nothobranchius furzeri]|uniref:RNA-binding protein 42 n=2 Tax=Nothobranchius TaxID=28779 RepID=A0A1A8UNH1_NOTFU|nr:RNA-binding protein 42 [Nothobranchius furzeri]XP_015805031.1 RNA-binding protein 42 [Nothobranchius furzeri]KAF7226392.1 transcript variant X1 [Nothobranchius furzeri]KAF7226393.1 transcript variant X2 [Nothobranchius furzeri]